MAAANLVLYLPYLSETSSEGNPVPQDCETLGKGKIGEKI